MCEADNEVIGPIDGYYIALAAWPASQQPGCFVGGFKLCRDKPHSYWDVIGAAAGWTAPVWPTARAALDDALRLGAAEVARRAASPLQGR